MKTSLEKARELYDKFDELLPCEGTTTGDTPIECAIIVIDEIDSIYQKLTPKDDPYRYLIELEYWQDVKEKLKKICA